MLGWLQGLGLALAGIIIAWSIVLLILYYIQRRRAKQQEKIQPLKTYPFISICIAIRNESENIPALIQSLQNLRYPPECFEVIFVDDHSEDKSRNLLDTVNNQISFQVFTLPSTSRGKKAALHMAIQNAKGDWILTTDADCRFGPDWVTSMVQVAKENQADMVCGPVVLQGNSLFSKWEALEFSSLVATAASGIQLGNPNFCNAANLLYRKEAFEDFHQNRKDNHLPGGDDVYFLHHLHQRKGSIDFALTPASMVTSKAQGNWQQFENQRIRWASKVFSGMKGSNFPLAVVLWVFHFLIIILAPIGFWLFPVFTIALFLLKISAEALYLFKFQEYVSPVYYVLRVAAMQFPYSLYVVFFGLRIRKTRSFQWKGRNY